MGVCVPFIFFCLFVLLLLLFRACSMLCFPLYILVCHWPCEMYFAHDKLSMPFGGLHICHSLFLKIFSCLFFCAARQNCWPSVLETIPLWGQTWDCDERRSDNICSDRYAYFTICCCRISTHITCLFIQLKLLLNIECKLDQFLPHVTVSRDGPQFHDQPGLDASRRLAGLA